MLDDVELARVYRALAVSAKSLAASASTLSKHHRANFDEKTPVVPQPAVPPWYTFAAAEVGVKEIVGPEHNPRVMEYLSSVRGEWPGDETPWCSAFVNWCITQTGLQGTESARARSWLDWGVTTAKPTFGCVVVLWRGSPASTSGHVGFYAGSDDRESIRLLGGNQKNRVCIATYPAARVVDYRVAP